MQRMAPSLLVILWLLAWHSGAQANSRVPTFGVKLCGREFIRAVIFTCGGSRWRRNDVLQTLSSKSFGALSSRDLLGRLPDIIST
ncbi:hypothetical protein GDO86_006992 [Hymenochirus boettgeri]|uniref:Uncharacterized protein n=1 Tax=Hymenochirus boettgeri TaxID=247094 RepID=A0A8T2JD16_9PIPI|nr:hypothetical protein GDO86_006992 [Hymenochirus boettgeri]